LEKRRFTFGKLGGFVQRKLGKETQVFIAACTRLGLYYSTQGPSLEAEFCGFEKLRAGHQEIITECFSDDCPLR